MDEWNVWGSSVSVTPPPRHPCTLSSQMKKGLNPWMASDLVKNIITTFLLEAEAGLKSNTWKKKIAFVTQFKQRRNISVTVYSRAYRIVSFAKTQEHLCFLVIGIRWKVVLATEFSQILVFSSGFKTSLLGRMWCSLPGSVMLLPSLGTPCYLPNPRLELNI